MTLWVSHPTPAAVVCPAIPTQTIRQKQRTGPVSTNTHTRTHHTAEHITHQNTSHSSWLISDSYIVNTCLFNSFISFKVYIFGYVCGFWSEGCMVRLCFPIHFVKFHVSHFTVVCGIVLKTCRSQFSPTLIKRQFYSCFQNVSKVEVPYLKKYIYIYITITIFIQKKRTRIAPKSPRARVTMVTVVSTSGFNLLKDIILSCSWQ